MMRWFAGVLGLVAWLGLVPAVAQERTLRIVAFGDSLTAGFGLSASEAFPAQLQTALRERGHRVEITNAGVSGDTTAGGRERLDWSVPDGTHAVILALGANDALRGLDPRRTEAALDDMIGRLKRRNIAVLLVGMLAPRTLGPDYVAAFDGIFPRLSQKHGVPLYPFFLDGVALDRSLNLADGIHPNARGVAVMVRGILPHVEKLIAGLRGA